MEARKHDNCPITFYEIVAEDFNNDDIRFTTQAVPELSYKFAHPSDLYFHDMPGGAITTDDVKSWYSASHASLIHLRENVLVANAACHL